MVSFRWKEPVRVFVYTKEENSVKRFRIWLMILLVILLLPLCAWAAEEDVSETPIYEARAWLDFHLRQEPESALRVGEIKIDTKVQVYSYDGEWCLVGWKDLRGWARVRWLWGFHSLDAARYPTPGHVPAVGAVMLERDTWIEGGEFTLDTKRVFARLKEQFQAERKKAQEQRSKELERPATTDELAGLASKFNQGKLF